MATMTAANRAVASAIMPLTISRGRGTERASEGCARNVLSQRLATTGVEPSSNRQGCYSASLEQEPRSLGAWEREVLLMKKRVQKFVYDGGKL